MSGSRSKLDVAPRPPPSRPGQSNRPLSRQVQFDRVPLFVGRYLERRGLRYTEPVNKRFPTTFNEEHKLAAEELEHLRSQLAALAKMQS